MTGVQTCALPISELLYKRALAIRQKVLGPEHSDVATSLENYAILLRKMDRLEEAARLESGANAIRRNLEKEKSH